MLANYTVNRDNLLFQLERPGFVYDVQYVAERYDTYGVLNDLMSQLRLGSLISAIGHIPGSLVDVGYGNGSFLKAAHAAGIDCEGYDVSGYPLPSGVRKSENWVHDDVEVVTMFDVIEHFDTPYVVEQCRAQYLVMSTPWCHYAEIQRNAGEQAADQWFQDWKHRRPNEHLWFFDPYNLQQFAARIGARVLSCTNVEDTIRKSVDGRPNILTAVLRLKR